MPTKKQLSQMREWEFEFTYLDKDGNRQFKPSNKESMTQPEKIKLVAEWMGHKNVFIHSCRVYASEDDTEIIKYGNYSVPKYAEDWDSLHEAWKKLYPELKAKRANTFDSIHFLMRKFEYASIESNISKAFECLVEGIQLVQQSKELKK